MKIIFKNDDEMYRFFSDISRTSTCPGDLRLPMIDGCNVDNCGQCWKNVIPYEVKGAVEARITPCDRCVYFDSESIKPICVSCNWHTNNHDDPYRDYYRPANAPHNPCLTCVHLGNGVTNEGLGECEECINYSNHTRLKEPEA